MKMGKITKLGTIVLILGLLSPAVYAAKEVYKEDFESGQAPGWELKANYQNSLTIGIVDGGAEDSKYAYEIRRDAEKKDTMFQLFSSFITITAGKNY